MSMGAAAAVAHCTAMTDRPPDGEAPASPLPDISDIIGTGPDDDAPATAGRASAASTIEAVVDGIEWADTPPAGDGQPEPGPAAGAGNGSRPPSAAGDGSIDLRTPEAAAPAPPRPPQRPRADAPAQPPAAAPAQLGDGSPPAEPEPELIDPAVGLDDPTAPVPAGGFIVPPEADEPPLDATQPIDVADLAATQAIPVTELPKVGSNRLLDAVLAVERAEAATRAATGAASPGPAPSDDTTPLAPSPDPTRPMAHPFQSPPPFDPASTQVAPSARTPPDGAAPPAGEPPALVAADGPTTPIDAGVTQVGPSDGVTTPFDPTTTAPAPPPPTSADGTGAGAEAPPPPLPTGGGAIGAGVGAGGDAPEAGETPAVETADQRSPAVLAAATAAEAAGGGPAPGAIGSSAPGADAGSDTQAAAATAATPGSEPPDGSASPADGPAPPAGAGRRRRLGPLPLVGVGVLAVLALVTAAWGIDSARTDGEVMRGTRLAGTDIGGLSEDELTAVFDDLDTDLSQAQLTARIDEVTVETNPAALGAAVDRERQTDAALAARRGGNPVLHPVRWLASFVTSEDLQPVYEVDPEMAASGAQDVLTAALDQPIDPGITVDDGELTLEEGKAGVQVEAADVAQALPPALTGPGPYLITLQAVPAEPRYTNDQVQAVVDDATTATSEPVEVRVLDKRAELVPATMRSWIRLDSSGDEPSWTIDDEAALSDLKPLFPSLGSEDERAHFNVVDNVPIIIPASSTIICCTAESVEGVADVIRQPPLGTGAPNPEKNPDPERRVAELEPENVGADEGVNELASLGIVEEVSTFTTKHPCCQNRVTNIHRIADIVRGAVIRPGEDFSVNGFVGERTIAKGFVADHAIVDGVLKDQVGGGVSQFATTFFNASFFAGLEFNEYQSHSLYISRYPKGREATVSWKKPDLSVKNTTPYGILVWTSYTDTSLTVTFYSTKNVEVTAGNLLSSSQGECTRYTTPRTRVYPDGTTKEDSVFATYRPAEGVGCDGKPTKGATAPAGPTVIDPSVGAPIPQPVIEGGGASPPPTLLDTPPDGG